jgi:16S rRNA (guanine(966)-N(2))-methyltransferase RsmD
MRVISGKFKNKLLIYPKNIRPSSQLHKKILFDTIRPYLDSCNFLDLFAGSGQIGIEALSQGANHVTFVEKEIQAIKSIRQNLENCRITKEFYDIKNYSVKLFISKNKSTYDIIYADPPYQLIFWPDLDHIINLMHHSSIFILKYSPKNPPLDFPKLKLIQTKTSTDTNLNFYTLQ